MQEWIPIGCPSPLSALKLVRNMPFGAHVLLNVSQAPGRESTALTHAKEKNTLLDHVELISLSLHS